MIIIVYSETTDSQIESRLGKSEYSYYFVLSAFRPVLEQLGLVVLVGDPVLEVDAIFRDAAKRGEACIFLSFAPPHRTPLGLICPTIPVFAWEFDTIPNETWFGEREQDWRFVLNQLGRAITHSTTTIGTVQAAMGINFPIASIPAPVWDRFATLRHIRRAGPVPVGTTLSLAGTVIDTRSLDLSIYDHAEWMRTGKLPPAPTAADPKERVDVELDGIVYVSVFNPYDGRKNWIDMMGGFCWAFREVEDATLILKLTHYDCDEVVTWMLEHLQRMTPFKCRVLLMHGYLDTPAYERLVTVATYSVNASHGEGQCLPLMEFMACGKPAVTPCHTGMTDYIDNENAFVVQSSAEPAGWPHDPRQAYRTLRQRINLESLIKAYRDSHRVAKEEPENYARMADNAHEALRRYCSRDVTADRIADFLKQSPRPAEVGKDYGKIKPRFDAPWIVEAS